LFQPFQPFNRFAPFKSLKLTESIPAVQVRELVPVVAMSFGGSGLYFDDQRRALSAKV
jgi:predicted nucleic acid-binding Zn ribbon protein